MPRHPDLDACVSMLIKTHGCMLVIEACFMDRPRVATPGKIWLTAAALCSLVEHRLRGSKSQDTTNTAFRSGHPGRPGTSHPRRTCRAQRVSSVKRCACKITGVASSPYNGEPRSLGARLKFRRARQEDPDAPCFHCASSCIAPRPRHAHRFAALFLSHARTTVDCISAQARDSR